MIGPQRGFRRIIPPPVRAKVKRSPQTIAPHPNSFALARKNFLLAHPELKPAHFNMLVKLTRETFTKKPTTPEHIAELVSNKGNLPYTKAYTFANFMIWNWERK